MLSKCGYCNKTLEGGMAPYFCSWECWKEGSKQLRTRCPGNDIGPRKYVEERREGGCRNFSQISDTPDYVSIRRDERTDECLYSVGDILRELTGTD